MKFNPHEILFEASRGGFVTVHKSATELLFCKKNGPRLGQSGYNAGAVLGAEMALEIITEGCQSDLTVRMCEDGATL